MRPWSSTKVSTPYSPGIEDLEAIEQVAVALEHVDGVLARVTDLDVSNHGSVSTVDSDPDVLDGTVRSAVAGLHAARVDDYVVRTDARPLDLEVAADARSEVGDPVPILEWRRSGGSTAPGSRPSTAIRFWSLGQ